MSVGGYAGGMLLLLANLGAAAVAAQQLYRRRLQQFAGAERVIAQALIVTCVLALSILMPGALGILTRGTELACSLALAALAGSVPHTASARDRRPTVPNSDSLAATAVAVLAGLIVAAWLLSELLHAGASVVTSTDAISYDLPIIGRWIQSGNVWPVTELFPLQTHGTYPQTANLVLAAFILPFHNDAFVRFPAYASLGIAALALYATGRELGATRHVAAVFAAMFAALPTVAWDVELGPADTIGLAAFAAGVLFLVRRSRTRQTQDLVLGGVGLGLAAGSRWYFSSAVVALAALWIVASVIRGHPLATHRGRLALRSGAGLLGVILATSGFWLVRNLVETGDPFYPVRIAVAGATVFPAPHDVYRAIAGFSIAHYSTDTPVISHYLIPALRQAASLGGLLLLLAVIAALAEALVRARRRRPQRATVTLLAIASLLLAIVYALTPYSAFGPAGHPTFAWANVRYLLPALTIAVPVAAALVAALPAAGQVAAGLAATVATVIGVRGADQLLGTGRTALAGGVTLVILGAGAWFWVARRGREGRRRWTVAASLPAAVLLLVGGYAVQHRLNATRYANYDPTYAWIQEHPTPLKVGLAGSFNFGTVSPAWAMFGPRIENPVAFVGRLHDGRLTQYRNRADWLRAIRRGHFDVLEIAIGKAPPPTTDVEVSWAAQEHLPVIQRSARFELVRAQPRGR